MPTVLITLLKELLMATIAKVAWKAVAERFWTRLVLLGLEKLKEKSTNDVVDETVQDVIDALKGKRLKVVEELPNTQDPY
ncbi:MAG: hypothetical protein K2W88_00120 [Pararheinheimera sp.]|nr:hypothetical protein [Rheinheimera sp.]